MHSRVNAGVYQHDATLIEKNMAKTTKWTLAQRQKLIRSGALQTVLTFGDLTLQFCNQEQTELVNHETQHEQIVDVWVSSEKAFKSILAQLVAAKDRFSETTSPISNWAEQAYCW